MDGTVAETGVLGGTFIVALTLCEATPPRAERDGYLENMIVTQKENDA